MAKRQIPERLIKIEEPTQSKYNATTNPTNQAKKQKNCIFTESFLFSLSAFEPLISYFPPQHLLEDEGVLECGRCGPLMTGGWGGAVISWPLG